MKTLFFCLVIQLTGKIPIEARAINLRLYPVLGIEYSICLDYIPNGIEAGSSPDSWNDFIAVVGFGGDLNFKKIYI